MKSSNSHPSRVILLFLVLLFFVIGFLFLFGFPVRKIQAADFNENSNVQSFSQPILASNYNAIPTTLPSATPVEILTAVPDNTPEPLTTEEPTLQTIPLTNLVAEKSFISYASHSWDAPIPVTGSTDFWIEVDLSQQRLFGYDGSNLLKTFLVSTGTDDFRTVTGFYKIYAKYPTYNMVGPGYNLPNVPYSMFFYKGYSIHGTYWHHNFGTPMSHGCVNMETSAAAWVYAHAKIGTNVFVHY